MSKSNAEDLSLFISRVIKLKKLSAREVAQRAEGEITASYVAGMMNGSAWNPSVEKLRALARGLGVDVHEVFDAACGLSSQEESPSPSVDISHTMMILDLMQKVVMDPDLTEILQAAIPLSPKKRELVLKFLRELDEAERKRAAQQ